MITISQITNKLNNFGITNKLEQAHFLAQTHHESGGFTKLSEGSNYRYGRAKEVWKSRKDDINALQLKNKAKDDDFVPQPILFNMVYGSRMGNDSTTNDGYDYRGGGLIQLTGKSNYMDLLNWLTRQGKFLTLNMKNIADWVRSDEGAIISAIYFWLKNDIGKLARADKITDVTKKINGGNIGIDERKTLTAKYKAQLKV